MSSEKATFALRAAFSTATAVLVLLGASLNVTGRSGVTAFFAVVAGLLALATGVLNRNWQGSAPLAIAALLVMLFSAQFNLRDPYLLLQLVGLLLLGLGGFVGSTAYRNLSDAIKSHVGDLETTRAQLEHRHRAFLAARPLAETAPGAEEKLRTMAVALERAAGEVAKCAAALETERARFDADRLVTLRKELATASEALAMRTSELRHADDALKLARKRHEEWQRATTEHARLSRELERRDAALALVEKARRILRDSAPRVAQHLCDRIAARAQRLFNRINHDPSELVWSAERYSLRIEPGERRFAMLSGGEQTKLALAMTLAMIQEFSTLRFCLFDEPTYGVDADSREMLAEAIVEVQKISGLDQLLLVSHDDAFDGKIEHVVSVKKNAATGTAVEILG